MLIFFHERARTNRQTSQTPKKPLNSVAKLGSNWNNGSNAGSFYWNVNNTSSNRNRNISGQLLNAQSMKTIIISALPLGKTQKFI